MKEITVTFEIPYLLAKEEDILNEYDYIFNNIEMALGKSYDYIAADIITRIEYSYNMYTDIYSDMEMNYKVFYFVYNVAENKVNNFLTLVNLLENLDFHLDYTIM